MSKRIEVIEVYIYIYICECQFQRNKAAARRGHTQLTLHHSKISKLYVINSVKTGIAGSIIHVHSTEHFSLDLIYPPNCIITVPVFVQDLSCRRLPLPLHLAPHQTRQVDL